MPLSYLLSSPVPLLHSPNLIVTSASLSAARTAALSTTWAAKRVADVVQNGNRITRVQPALDLGIGVVGDAKRYRRCLETSIRLADVDSGGTCCAIPGNEAVAHADHILRHI